MVAASPDQAFIDEISKGIEQRAFFKALRRLDGQIGHLHGHRTEALDDLLDESAEVVRDGRGHRRHVCDGKRARRGLHDTLGHHEAKVPGATAVPIAPSQCEAPAVTQLQAQHAIDQALRGLTQEARVWRQRLLGHFERCLLVQRNTRWRRSRPAAALRPLLRRS